MSVKLYKYDISPPARAVMMALDIFCVSSEKINVDLDNGEHLKPEFLKKNPLHTVPVLEDKGIILTDSHAILQYLAEAYGKEEDDTWYPKDVKQRALVNQKLFFNACILYRRIWNITYPLFVKGEKKVPKEKWDDISEAYSLLEKYLSQNKFLASDSMTIADVAALPSVQGLDNLMPLDSAKYPKTRNWLSTMEKQAFSLKNNEPGNKMYRQVLKEELNLS